MYCAVVAALALLFVFVVMGGIYASPRRVQQIFSQSPAKQVLQRKESCRGAVNVYEFNAVLQAIYATGLEACSLYANVGPAGAFGCFALDGGEKRHHGHCSERESAT